MKLVYLGGSHRFTETSAYDFYFSCNVRGRNLQWVINGTGYAAYHHGQILTTVPVHRESLANFNYTSTLLSLKVDGDYQKLDSVLFVSVQDNITINVCCVSDTGRNISSNREVPKSQSEYKQATSSDGHISMFHLWDGPVVSNDGDNTRCFMCGVDFSNQFWETSNNDQLTFDTGFPLGSESNLPSIDNSVLRLQTILFAHSPKLVSLFLVTDSTVVNVTCNAGGMSLSSTQLRIVQGTSTVEDIDNLTIPDVTTNNLVGSQRTFETITEGNRITLACAKELT